jgi:class 3 adenylate cyclase
MMGGRFGAAHARAEMAEPAVAAVGSGTMPGPGPRAGKLSASPSSLRTASISSARGNALLRQMSARGLGDDRLLATVYPHATVLVLRFFDDLAMAAHADAEPGMGVIARIVEAFQTISERLEIRYVKFLTDQIVAVEGFDREARTAAVALAEAALVLQDECARSFAHLGGRLDYAIGLDTGTVIGSSVGFGESAYNVWGDAVRIASTMASSARRGTIQASEASYEQLRDRFVFRRRGAFYLEQVGEMTTYVLRGRL